MITGILLLLIFFIMAILMFLRKLPVLIALPVMALLIAAVGGIPFDEILTSVLGKGSIRLVEAYTVAMFGGMLSFLLQKSGVAESFIKKGAELSGDDPWKVGFIMLLLIIILFTTIGGLGAIIMVATIVLPIMASVGITPLISGALFLIGLSAGGILNAGNWVIYINVLHLDLPTVRNYAFILFAISLIIAALFMTVELWRAHQIKSLKKYIIRASAFICSAAILFFLSRFISLEIKEYLSGTILPFLQDCGKYFFIGIGLLACISMIRDYWNGSAKSDVPVIAWYAYLIPIVPLVLILMFQLHFVSAFFIALVFGYLATLRKGALNLLTQAVIEGSASVIPAVILMFGIGMLLNSIIGPSDFASTHNGAEWPVIGYLRPIITIAIPDTWLGYIIIFTIAAPLALYRGPLNVWGLGYGIAAVMLATGKIGGAAIMAVLLSVGQVQGVCDPTNTQNVWLANELKLDVQQILWRTLPYMWLLAFLGLIVGSILFY